MFTTADIPDQTGRLALVTGANTGLGYETARQLLHAGADVVLACRNPELGQAALETIRGPPPESNPRNSAQRPGQASLSILDLADLEQVKSFAHTFQQQHTRLDLLVNNAGVMIPPQSYTKQNYELQFGVNHLGHAALTALLLPLLARTAGSRIVVVASAVHHYGHIDFDDLHFRTRPYADGTQGYMQSKLANLLWALELQRRLDAAGLKSPTVTAAHPGWTASDLQRSASWVIRLGNILVAMSVAQGALPTLLAATAPYATGGSYWGPQGLLELRGPPGVAKINPKARDQTVAARLWDVTEQLTGVPFDVGADADAVGEGKGKEAGGQQKARM